MTSTGTWPQLLEQNAVGYARVAMANISREFPNAIRHTMTWPGDFPVRPRARNPVFYGSFDWHSCVEMHWLLLRLLRTAAPWVPAGGAAGEARPPAPPAGAGSEGAL